MKQDFLEQESVNANRRKRNLFLALFLFFSCVSLFLYLATKNSMDLGDSRDQMLMFLFYGAAGFMLFCTMFGLLMSMRPAKDGQNLKLPLGENTKEAVAAKINQEVAEGKVLLEEFMNHKTGKKYQDRILLLPSYLLLIENMGKITAIPRNKIYWICAQIGYKGGPFYVRLLIFTEKKILDFDGNDIENTKEIADRLYQYIPNVFKAHDPQKLSYELEKLFQENYPGFVEFYEDEKRKSKQ